MRFWYLIIACFCCANVTISTMLLGLFILKAGKFTICVRSMCLPFEPALCKLIYLYVFIYINIWYIYMYVQIVHVLALCIYMYISHNSQTLVSLLFLHSLSLIGRVWWASSVPPFSSSAALDLFHSAYTMNCCCQTHTTCYLSILKTPHEHTFPINKFQTSNSDLPNRKNNLNKYPKS